MRSRPILLASLGLVCALSGCNLIAYDIIASGRDLSPADAGVETRTDGGGSNNDQTDAGPTDPCATDNGGCAAVAVCESSGQSVTCTCPSGYTGNGEYCDDIEECLSTDRGGCDPNATCTNLPGSYTCECKPGFDGDGKTCTDVDECATGNGGCDPNATCTNTVGSRTCECNQGYEGDGVHQCVVRPWDQVGTLPETRSNLAGALDGDRLYLTGGYDPLFSGASPTVWMTTLNSDGTVGPVQSLGFIPDGLVDHCSVVVGRTLFTIGGLKPTGPNILGENANVGTGVLRADGTIEYWTGTMPLPSARSRVACVAVNDRIYVLGGQWRENNQPVRTDEVLFATVDTSNGVIAKWETTTPLPEPLAGLALARNGNTLYVTGGDSAQNPSRRETHFATIQSDGTLSAWTATHAPTLAVNLHGSRQFVLDGYLYLLGLGAERAAINGDGTLSTWSAVTPEFDISVQRSYHVAVGLYGHGFVFGGVSAFGGRLADIRAQRLE